MVGMVVVGLELELQLGYGVVVQVNSCLLFFKKVCVLRCVFIGVLFFQGIYFFRCFVCLVCLWEQQYCVVVVEEMVVLFDCVLVGFEYLFFVGKCGDYYQQCVFWQVEIGYYCVDVVDVVVWGDEDLCFICEWQQFVIVYCVFQCVYYGGVDVDYLVIGCVCVLYLLYQFGVDVQLFVVYYVVFQVFGMYWLEGVCVYVQGDVVEFYVFFFQCGQ